MSDVKNKPTLILGIGNILLGDEGFGVHVAQGLQEIDLPSHIRVREGGVSGFNLLGELDGVERLLVVDVMIMDQPPGYLRLFKPGSNIEPGKRIVSFHQMGVIELIQIWSLLGYEPELFFLVTQPGKMECSMELSPPLRCATSRAIE